MIKYDIDKKNIKENLYEDIVEFFNKEVDVGKKDKLNESINADIENRKDFEYYSKVLLRLKYTNNWNKINEDDALKTILTRVKMRKRRKIIYVFSSAAAMLILFICFKFIFNNPTSSKVDIVNTNFYASANKVKFYSLDGNEYELDKNDIIDLENDLDDFVNDKLKVIDYGMNKIYVPTGGEYFMIFSDGTKVWMNSETSIEFPLTFDDEIREIKVYGEIFLDVVKDEKRPFIVHTQNSIIEVLGTSFNVMSYPDESKSEITLVNGSIQVSIGDKIKNVIPGEQLSIDNTSLDVTTRMINTDFYPSWKDGLFDFDGMSLQDLSMKLERWYDVHFVFIDECTKNIKFSGAVKKSNNLDFILDFIKNTSDIDYKINGNKIEIFSTLI